MAGIRRRIGGIGSRRKLVQLDNVGIEFLFLSQSGKNPISRRSNPSGGKNKMNKTNKKSVVAAGRRNARGKFYFYSIFAVAIFFPSLFIASAQFSLPTSQLPNLNMKPVLTMSAEPTTPSPNSVLRITANLSSITNISNSAFTWFVNNVKQKEASGLNKNIFILRTGGVGSVYKITVNISTPGGDNLSDSMSFTVSDFDLTWSASSQAPALYKGKILPTKNSTINMVALPTVYQPGTKTLIGSNNLVFNWSVDDKFQSAKSGAGKSNLSFTVPDFAGANKSILLNIKTLDGAVSLNKSIEIPIVRPQTIIRWVDPKTEAPYGGALKNLSLKLPMALNFIAQNYFFNAPPDGLRWQWFVNGEEAAADSGKPWLASLNFPDIKTAFSIQIKVAAKNPNSDLEIAQSIVNVNTK